MTPAFGLPEAKALVPVFARSVNRASLLISRIEPFLRVASFTAGGQMAGNHRERAR